MLRQIVVGVVATGLAVGTIGVQPAQSTDSCKVALAEAKYRIESKNTTVVQIGASDMSKEIQSSEYPEKYPIQVFFVLEGPGTESIMNSTIFLKALSSKIIIGCDLVSLVIFGVNHTDWNNTFGLLDSNKVEEFECLPFDFNRRIPWGYTVCL